MTYYESAEGLEISFERAVFEFYRHGVTDPQEIAEQLRELGPAPYDAQAVLGLLGY